MAAAAILLFAGHGSLGVHSLRDQTGVRWGYVAQIAIAAITGISVVALATLDLFHERTPESALLAAWTAGTLVFAVFLNWSVTARALLPLAPVVGILIARRMERRAASGVRSARWTTRWALAAAAALALLVAWADKEFALTSRDAAMRLEAQFEHKPRAIWFQGHWGFQYYAAPRVFTARLSSPGNQSGRSDR